ncbi:Hypothetical protein PHPALM_3187 [Phytophthora palmivora]|uniref:Uncharacterized protein n=1 Tax=Phytophthora palmivora TaxID=4796 RepID=A0A2P4YN22_9STRA|nr:Hypothetical protein PHPALM_3187 [Phytophthora palmivora]
MVMNQHYVSALVPALSEILVLHTVTTTTISTVMQILDQIAFANPSIIISNDQLDIPALSASCSLHHRSSLSFAQFFCRFCNSIAAEFRAIGDDDFGRFVPLVPLVFEIIHHWKSNDEIIDLCLATTHDIIGFMRIDHVNDVYPGDLLGLLNAAVIPFTSNSPTSWNWLKCMLSIFNKMNKVTSQSAQEVISTVVGIIHMFMSHSFMVEKALKVLILLKLFTTKKQ